MSAATPKRNLLDERERFVETLMNDEMDDHLAMVGPWLENKRPRSVEARRYLAAGIRGWRICREAGVISPAADAEYLGSHARLKRAIIAAEESFAPDRKAYFARFYRSIGGVQ